MILKSEYLSDSSDLEKNIQPDKIDSLTKLLHGKIFYKYPITLKHSCENMSEKSDSTFGKTDHQAKQNSLIDDGPFPNIGSADLGNNS